MLAGKTNMKLILFTLLAFAGSLQAEDVTTRRGTEEQIVQTIPLTFPGEEGGQGRFIVAFTNFKPTNADNTEYLCYITYGIRMGIHIYGPLHGTLRIHYLGGEQWSAKFRPERNQVLTFYPDAF
jgi:hypothetical protein